MGGEIGMSGREGGGSNFWFRLPLRVAPSATLMLPPTFTTTGRVLVVDDLEINRRVLSRQLTSWRIEHRLRQRRRKRRCGSCATQPPQAIHIDSHSSIT